MEEMTISIGDMLASLARKGKQIICCGVIFAILLGGFKSFTVWKTLNDEEYVDYDQITYEQELLRLERVIETAERGLSDQKDYLANSMWMELNPYDKHTTDIYLMVSGIDESDVTMTFGDTTTPKDYLLSRILNQYSIFWSAEDLSKSLGLSKYENLLDRYIRELIYIGFLDGGVIRVSASGNTAEESRELANAAVDLLLKKSDVVRENSFDHILSVFNTVQQNQVDTEMAERQYAHYLQIDTYNANIVAAEKALLELKAPDSIAVNIIKMILIGGVLGGVLACAYHLGKAILTGIVQSSAHMERTVSVPFTGTLAKQKGIFDKLANLLSGERLWNDDTQAMEYTVEMIKLRLPGKKLLLASTLKLSERAQVVEQLRSALSVAGIETDLADDVFHYPGTPAALNNCDGVLLLEQVEKTSMSQVLQVCQLAKECEKNVIGFVLV